MPLLLVSRMSVYNLHNQHFHMHTFIIPKENIAIEFYMYKFTHWMYCIIKCPYKPSISNANSQKKTLQIISI